MTSIEADAALANSDEDGDVPNGRESPSETNSKTLMERVQARVRNDSATDFREDIVRSIFGEVGTPVEGEWAFPAQVT